MVQPQYDDQTEVLVGLGSNRPWQEVNSLDLVQAGMGRLQPFADGRLRRSRLFRTSPVDCPPESGAFVNAAVAFAPRPGLTPEALLAATKAIEGDFGRARDAVKNAPRALDLDILAFGRECREGEDLCLPHPRAEQRAFVLVPLAEVAPEFVWPGTELTVRELLDQLVTDEEVVALDDCLDRP